jgi:hypothetical protein
MKHTKRLVALVVALVLTLALAPSAAAWGELTEPKPELPDLPGQYVAFTSMHWFVEDADPDKVPTFTFSRHIPDEDLWVSNAVKIYKGGVMRADQDSYMLLQLTGSDRSNTIQYAPGEEDALASEGIHVIPTEQVDTNYGWDYAEPCRVYKAGHTFRFDETGIYDIRFGNAEEDWGMVTVYVVEEEDASAKATSSKITVDGKAVNCEAYTINGNNYFKLRDIAQVLSGSEKQFEVTWDGAKKTINLISGQPYTTVGGELQPGNGSAKDAKVCQSPIYQDGKEAAIFGFTINGNNYFKLRDLGAAFDFGVTWDAANNCVMIDTTTGYTPE